MSIENNSNLKPRIVIVHVIRGAGESAECLLLRRCSTNKGNWQMVAGKVETGEATISAVQRELFEETGLTADRLYSADFTEMYFDINHDSIFIAPVFIAFIENTQTIQLSKNEHDKYQWISLEGALSLLEFTGQQNALIHIKDKFLSKKQYSKHLKIL